MEKNGVLVCGSIAYDHIMEFPGLFKEHIVTEKIDSLNVSFLANSLNKMRGGTAPNIAYSMALLGLKPFVLGTAGKDFMEYKQWLENNNVDTRYIKILEDDYTASCFITTDQSNNQITVFYPGAMSKDTEISLKKLNLENMRMVIIAPTEPAAMVKWARECAELNIPYLYDPGMQIPRLTREELIAGVTGAEIVIFNEYEYSMLNKKTGLDYNDILNTANLVVVTLGEKGSILRTKKEKAVIASARPEKVVDPTGCGDAYRAGLLKGYFEGASLENTGKYASISAVYVVEHKGATEHKYSIDDFNERYYKNYGGNFK